MNHAQRPCGRSFLALSVLLAAFLAGSGCRSIFSSSDPQSATRPADQKGQAGDAQPPVPGAGARYVPISIIATNDIHGGVEPGYHITAKSRIGGMEFFAGVVSAIRKGMDARGGGTIVVDAGDQFQGTLISNYNEGELVFKLMDEIGYDAVVPGNHDYDFGPRGWLKDRATAPGENPREVIEGLAKKVTFPLISANTYLTASLKDRTTGKRVEVASNSCATSSNVAIDWTRAARPAFLKPYVIKNVRGVRVAMIGLDNPATATMTTGENVRDLCFRDPVAEYAETEASIRGQADVFVLVIHGADSPGSYELSDWVRDILRRKRSRLDAVIAGHTHMIQKTFVDGVPIIQSGSGGERFGRIDVVVDTESGAIVSRDTQVVSGVALLHEVCDHPKAAFCQKRSSAPLAELFYDGHPVQPSASAARMIQEARAEIEPLGSRRLFSAATPLKRNRISESPMSNLLTDALRRTSGTDIAFMNTGGIRSELPAGDVTYEQFFEVLPFGNLGVVAEPMTVPRLLKLLQRSIQTCGDHGALMQSGLRVRFERDCRGANQGGIDPNARLLSVETVGGQILYDSSRSYTRTGVRFRVATLDFLLDGGSGYTDFRGIPRTGELGILRERLADEFLGSNPMAEVSGEIDGRWEEVPSQH